MMRCNPVFEADKHICGNAAQVMPLAYAVLGSMTVSLRVAVWDASKVIIQVAADTLRKHWQGLSASQIQTPYDLLMSDSSQTWSLHLRPVHAALQLNCFDKLSSLQMTRSSKILWGSSVTLEPLLLQSTVAVLQESASC